MKRRIAVFILGLLGLLAGGPLTFGFEGALFTLFEVPYAPRAAALGGLHAALADDESTLFSNPAGFRTPAPRLSLASTALSIYDSAPILINDVLTGTPDIPSGGIGSWFSLAGPLSLAYVGNGLGFGIFTDTNVRAWNWGPYPQGMETIDQYLVAIPGYAFRIPLPEEWHSTLDVGLSIPLFITARSLSRVDVRGLFMSLVSPMDIVATQPFWLIKGAGVEAGLLYSFDKVFSFGIAGRNLAITSVQEYTSLQSYFTGGTATTVSIPLPMSISFGIRWSPPIHQLLRSVDEISFLLDYSNAFDFLIYPAGATNPLLHIGAGIEVRVLGIVSVQAGFYQCLPSAGLSLDLTYLKLDLAVFGREATRQPGGYPVWGYLIALTM